MIFGEHIKELRDSKELLQQQLVASLQINTLLFCKIECGEEEQKNK